MVEGGLPPNGWDSLAHDFRANRPNQILIRAYNWPNESIGGQMAYLLTPIVPEPTSLLLLTLAAASTFLSRRRLHVSCRFFTPITVAVCAIAPHVAHAVTIDTVPIGNPGNLADTRYDANGIGSVAYEFRMGKTEITNTSMSSFSMPSPRRIRTSSTA
jgi:hypothetical protein